MALETAALKTAALETAALNTDGAINRGARNRGAVYRWRSLPMALFTAAQKTNWRMASVWRMGWRMGGEWRIEWRVCGGIAGPGTRRVANGESSGELRDPVLHNCGAKN